MALTHYYITNDLRTDYTTLPGLSGVLSGKYIYYDSASAIFIDTTSVVNLKKDNIITIALWDTVTVNEEESLIDWEIDTTKAGLVTGSWLTNGIISDVQDAQHWREVLDHTDFNIVRNRAFTQLFGQCVPSVNTREPVGYNTSVRLSDIGNSALYVRDPLIYEFHSDGIVTFYFSPQPQSGWLRCYPDEFYDRIAVPNPDYDPALSTALSPCDVDGWRTVLNAPYYGEEQNFYPDGKTDWWTFIEGLGHNIKIRYLDSAGNPLPLAAWYAVTTIKTGVGGYSQIGTTLGPNGVSKVEIRYIEEPDWVKKKNAETIFMNSTPADEEENVVALASIDLEFNKNVDLGYGPITLTPQPDTDPNLVDVKINRHKYIDLVFDEDVDLSNLGEIKLTPYSDVTLASTTIDLNNITLDFTGNIIPNSGNINISTLDTFLSNVSGNNDQIVLDFSRDISTGSGNITLSKLSNISITSIQYSTNSFTITFTDPITTGIGSINLDKAFQKYTAVLSSDGKTLTVTFEDQTIQLGTGSIIIGENAIDSINKNGNIEIEFPIDINFGSGKITIVETSSIDRNGNIEITFPDSITAGAGSIIITEDI